MHSVWHLNRRIGATLSCLFLRVFGNAAGVIVPMFAIFGGQMTIARSFLIGSILSSVLFSLGFSELRVLKSATITADYVRLLSGWPPPD